MPRATQEEFEAAVEAMKGRPIPPEVLSTLRIAAASSQLGVAAFIPEGGTRHYYVLIAQQPDGDQIALGVIPHGGLSVGQFIRLHDEWMDVCGSAESDPEFKGVKQ